MPIQQLSGDLRSGNVPRFSYIVPDECHDMHGDPPYCLDSGNIFDPQNQHLVSVGDAYLGQLVAEHHARGRLGKVGNNAIIITFDEGDDSKGCCDANPGAGRVATVVVTSHGPRAVEDRQQANHYSTLGHDRRRTSACPASTSPATQGTSRRWSDLVAFTGSKAIATRMLRS